MSKNSDASATTSTARLSINVCPDDIGIGDESLHLQEPFRPPLDPPSFEPVHVRRCIRTNVRIQNENHDSQEEVLILTSLTSPVDMFLNAHHHPAAAEDDGMDDDSEDGSDLSKSSSSLSFSSSYEDIEEEDDNVQNNCTAPNGDRNNREVSRMRAYWLWRDPICRNDHGIFSTHIFYARGIQKADLNWITTDEVVAIKRVSWEFIRASQNRLSEDFIKEIATLKYLSDFLDGTSMTDTHILTADVVMSDESYLYLVMPYCAGGDMCTRVGLAERFRLSEDDSRRYFLQLLKGLETLQRAKICHKDLSPENLMLLDDKSLVIDFGMSLRIPYSSNGRHLITPRPFCGKRQHVAPEIFICRPFDGHAVDIWAAGTILLFMLTGYRFEYPPLYDKALDAVDLGVSNEAMDLLTKMFRLNPNDRMNLEEIRNHPFLRG